MTRPPVEERYFAGAPWYRSIGPKVGIQTVMADAVDRYVDKIVQPVEYSMRGLEFLVDAANGAAFLAAPSPVRAGRMRRWRSSTQIRTA